MLSVNFISKIEFKLLGTPTVTNPAPALMAELAAKQTAPVKPGDAPITRIWP